MNKLSEFVLMASILCICSCSTRVLTRMETTLPAIDSQDEIRVFGLNSTIPMNSETLGFVKVGDTGFTINCGYFLVLEKVKEEARKVGGNAIKIIKHTPPGFSTCHTITARILRIDNSSSTKYLIEELGSINQEYAVLNIYCVSNSDTLVSYDLYLGDSVLCRITNNLKKTVDIRKEGLTSVWAKTGAKSEVQINFKFGQAYYIRCSQSIKNTVEIPVIEVIHPDIGIKEFDILARSN